MKVILSQELLQASDAVIDDAIAFADPIVLRGLLYQLTGDEEVAAVPTGAVSMGFRGEGEGISDLAHVALLRGKAAAFLKSCRDGGAGEIALGASERLHRSLELAAGCPIAADEVDMWIEQLAIDPMARGLAWRRQPPARRLGDFMVAVIGAGMAGLNAAAQLKHAGIPFTVFEKNGEVGGTWHENRYPGARVDTPSRLYSHIYGAAYPYPGPFCPQADNERYFNWVADHFELRDTVEFRTEVRSIHWDEGNQRWEIQGIGPDGPFTRRVNAVISAVGFLSRAKLPAFEGADSFAGASFHTSRWPEGLDLTDKRVAVIGSGATSYQMVPEIAKQAAHVTLFQRTPSWCVDVPGYLSRYPAQIGWLDRNFPFLVNFVRFHASWQSRPDGLAPIVEVDPANRTELWTSLGNKAMRDHAVAFLDRKLGHRPELRDKMLPDLPIMTGRPVLVDPDDNIFETLLRNNASLVTDPIDRVTPTGLRTATGEEVEADILIYATGFRANDFLWPMDVVGRDGQTIEALWARDGARAYIGTMLPGFPNFFMLYGPNTNPFGSGLGVVDVEELMTRFALKCIEQLILEGQGSVDVERAAYDRFAEEVDRRHDSKVYADPRITNYYRNEHGRSSANNPIDVRLLWNWLREPARSRPLSDAPVDRIVRPYFGEDLILR